MTPTQSFNAAQPLINALAVLAILVVLLGA
jgi:hypothetical protein